MRQLYGVVEAAKATAGILVTTSSFSGDARDYQTTVKNRLSLRDYEALLEWIGSRKKLWILRTRNVGGVTLTNPSLQRTTTGRSLGCCR